MNFFAHLKPADPGPYPRFFASPLNFNAEHYAVVFPARPLGETLPGADPERLRLPQAQIDALEAQHGDDFAGQVRGKLRTARPLRAFPVSLTAVNRGGPGNAHHEMRRL